MKKEHLEVLERLDRLSAGQDILRAEVVALRRLVDSVLDLLEQQQTQHRPSQPAPSQPAEGGGDAFLPGQPLMLPPEAAGGPSPVMMRSLMALRTHRPRR